MTLPATTSGRRDRLRLHGRGAAVACALSLALSGCAFGSSPDTTGQPPNLTPSPSPTRSTAAPSPSAAAGDQVLAKNLDVPWGLAFLPDGTALITERDTHRILEMAPGGKPTPVQTLRGIGGGGEGGLLGIAVSPRYEKDETVFVYYTTATDNRIAKLRLGGRPVPILTGIPSANVHNGGRIAFGPDGYLYAGTGDGGERSNSQDRASLGGKILRMTPEGKPAPGNPFPGSVVWSLGHRNVQGLAWDSRKRLYAAEFGQNRFDELNLIRAGRNYGWPEVEGIGRRAGFVDPLQTWTTDQASPSGVAISGGIAVLACLRGERLYAVALDPRTGRVHGDPKVLLEGEYGRLRTVVAAPDGSIWVTTSNRDGRGEPAEDDDRILRIVPPGGGGVSVL